MGVDLYEIEGAAGMNLAQNLVATATDRPDAPALRVGDDELSYRAFLDRAQASAGLLRAKGVQPGDRVGLILPNVPAFPVLFYGALLAGAAVVPMNPLLTDREIGFYLSDADVRLAFAFDQLPDGGAAAEKAGKDNDTDVLTVGATGLSDEQLDGPARASTSRPTRTSAPTKTSPCCSTPPALPASPRAPS